MTYRPKRPPRPPCPVEEVLDLVSGKWKAQILQLVALDYATFSEIRRALPGISPHVLSAQLKAMAADGLLERAPAQALNGAGARYRVTGQGQSLIGVLETVCDWGVRRLADRGHHWTPPPRNVPIRES